MADGVEKSAAAGGAGVAAWYVRGAALHEASTAACRGHRVRSEFSCATLRRWGSLSSGKESPGLPLAPNCVILSVPGVFLHILRPGQREGEEEEAQQVFSRHVL